MRAAIKNGRETVVPWLLSETTLVLAPIVLEVQKRIYSDSPTPCFYAPQLQSYMPTKLGGGQNRSTKNSGRWPHRLGHIQVRNNLETKQNKVEFLNQQGWYSDVWPKLRVAHTMSL